MRTPQMALRPVHGPAAARLRRDSADALGDLIPARGCLGLVGDASAPRMPARARRVQPLTLGFRRSIAPGADVGQMFQNKAAAVALRGRDVSQAVGVVELPSSWGSQ